MFPYCILKLNSKYLPKISITYNSYQKILLTGNPLVSGIFKLKITNLAQNLFETRTGFEISHKILPIETFCMSIPDKVTDA